MSEVLDHYSAKPWRLERIVAALRRAASALLANRRAFVNGLLQHAAGLYLLRVPLLTLYLLYRLPDWAFEVQAASQYLENLYVDLSLYQIALVSLLACLTSIASVSAINATLVNGGARFGVPMGAYYGGPFWIVAIVAPWPTLCRIVATPAKNVSFEWAIAAAALGAIGAVLALFFIRRAQLERAWKLREPSYHEPEIAALLESGGGNASREELRAEIEEAFKSWEPRRLVYPFPLTTRERKDWADLRGEPRKLGPLRTLLWDGFDAIAGLPFFIAAKRRGGAPHTPPSRLASWLPRLLKRNLPLEGYIYRPESENGHFPPSYPGPLYSAHRYLAQIVVFLAVVWAAFALTGVGAEYTPLEVAGVQIPPLAYLLLTLWIVCMVAAGITFLLDRYRLPVLTPFLLLGLVTSSCQTSQSEYPTQATLEGTPESALTAAELLRVRKEKPIVLVSAAGGGIRAAAWTTQVLSSLSEEIPGFARRVALVSGVSGGAVGAMQFVDHYDPERGPGEPTSFDDATRSSLKDIAWSLVTHDLPRFLSASILDPEMNRGLALDRALRRQTVGGGELLSEWERDVACGRRPAVLFGATLVESGKPLFLGTTRLAKAWNEEERPPYVDFRTVELGDGHADTQIATAARLSATFPFVTPVARSNAGTASVLSMHVADGGYYDASGTLGLSLWLESGLEPQPLSPAPPLERECESDDERHSGSPSPEAPLRILILELRPFGKSKTTPRADQGDSPFQITAPLRALYAVRDAGQSFRIDRDLQLLESYWEETRDDVRIHIHTVRFEEPGDARPAPLSWRLSKAQIEEVRNAWAGVKEAAIECVEGFLADDLDPACTPERP